jgi:single-strand DNA-binding protein
MSYHTIIVVGRLGRDPEMRYTPSGKAVTSFSIATSRKHNDSQGNQVEETIWFRITAWDKQAEICNNYLKKGREVLIEGHMNFDPKTGGPQVFTRKDGTTGASFEISASRVAFLGSRGDSGGGGGGSADDAAEEPAADEIPF